MPIVISLTKSLLFYKISIVLDTICQCSKVLFNPILTLFASNSMKIEFINSLFCHFCPVFVVLKDNDKKSNLFKS